MWLVTHFGAFHVIQPSRTATLTVRARRASELGRLRDTYLPQLGPTRRGDDDDYAFRAQVERDSLSRAMAAIAQDIRCDASTGTVEGRPRPAGTSFLGEVETALEHLDTLDDAADDHKRVRYGAVVFAADGKTLMYEPTGGFGGDVQFPKSAGSAWETGMEAAASAAAEKLGAKGLFPIAEVPGWHESQHSKSRFWVFLALSWGHVENVKNVARVASLGDMEAAKRLTKNKEKAAADRDEAVLLFAAQTRDELLRPVQDGLPEALMELPDLKLSSISYLANDDVIAAEDRLIAAEDRSGHPVLANLGTGRVDTLDMRGPLATTLSMSGHDIVNEVILSGGKARELWREGPDIDHHMDGLSVLQSPDETLIARLRSEGDLTVATIDPDPRMSLSSIAFEQKTGWDGAGHCNLAWTADSRFLVEANLGTALNAYDRETDETFRVPLVTAGHPQWVSTHPTAPLAIVGTGMLNLVDLEKRCLVWVRDHHDHGCDRHPAFSPCGTYIVYASCEHLVALPWQGGPPHLWRVPGLTKSPRFLSNRMLLSLGGRLLVIPWDELL